jgi:hypothetical protein
MAGMARAARNFSVVSLSAGSPAIANEAKAVAKKAVAVRNIGFIILHPLFMLGDPAAGSLEPLSAL